MAWVGFTIFTPATFIGFSLLAFHKFYLQKLDERDRWWTYRRAEKWSKFLWRATLWTSVFFFVFLIIMATQPFYGYIFNPTFLPNVVAVKLLIGELFYYPACVLMPLTSWTNLFFTKFKYYLREGEEQRIRDRDTPDRNVGSMNDYADEDEIWDMKLARLGL